MDGVKRRIDAYFAPSAPKKAIQIFNFFREHDRVTINAGGMQHYVMCLDKEKLINIAKIYNIDLGRYMFAFRVYESKMLEKQNRDAEQRQ